jgi:CDGSH iron-sulfur domain-containing protein 3
MPDKPANPWGYSDEYGYYTEDHKIRIFGFAEQPPAQLTPGRVARRRPVETTLKPGNYSWCTCGHSEQQPFCDHAHRDAAHQTNRKSYKFQVLEETTVKLCLCKKTKHPPFCDCAHEDDSITLEHG